MQYPKEMIRLQYDYQTLLTKFHSLEQLYLKQSNELIQQKKVNDSMKSNAENYECSKCQKSQKQVDFLKEENKKYKKNIYELEQLIFQKKNHFEEFQEQVQTEMQNRISQFEKLNQEALERLDRVQKDNTLFEILLHERDQRIDQLNQIIYDQEQQINCEKEEDNAWKNKFIKINRDYHKLLSEYNSIRADLDAMYVSKNK